MTRTEEDCGTERGSALAFYRVCVISGRDEFVSGISGPREKSPRVVGKDNENEDARGSLRSLVLLNHLPPSPLALSFSPTLLHCAALKIMAARNRLLIIWIRR